MKQAIKMEEDAQKALLERPKISIRSRIVGIFLVLFLLMSGITIASVVFISELKVKTQFVERVESYAFEIQQARRFEKNFFLYGTNLSDAMSNIQMARSILERSSLEMQAVVGQANYRSMADILIRYENLLEELHVASQNVRPHNKDELAQIEAQLRKYGVRLVDDCQAMIDEERLAMHSMLDISLVSSLYFLGFMFFVLIYISTLIIRAILRPLSRFSQYTERIGAGDYSFIMPVRKYRDEFSNLALSVNKMLMELKQRQDQLVQSAKMAAVGTLTSGIAHELNNPLNNIGLTTEALLDGFSDYSEDQKIKMLDQIYTQVERASSTVRNLLDFTRKEQPAFSTVVVPAILESTLKLAGNEAALVGVEMNLDIKDENLRVEGDPRSLQQVFLNLFLNSIQAMPLGGKLDVNAFIEGGFVRVDVADTGCGIAPENIEKVFEPFFTTKDPGEGTGLGLSVTYGILEKHNGKILVKSEIGSGTTFTVLIPLKKGAGSGIA